MSISSMSTPALHIFRLKHIQADSVLFQVLIIQLLELFIFREPDRLANEGHDDIMYTILFFKSLSITYSHKDFGQP